MCTFIKANTLYLTPCPKFLVHGENEMQLKSKTFGLTQIPKHIKQELNIKIYFLSEELHPGLTLAT